MNAVMEHALFFANHGVFVNAIRPGTKELVNRGKVMAGATRDPAAIERLFGGNDKLNLGVVPGPESNLLVIDVDVKGAARGFEALRVLEEQCGSLPKTLHERTGSGGQHYHYRLDGAAVRNGKLNIGGILGIELFSAHHNVVVAPSVVDGKPYELTERCEITALPSATLDFLTSCYATNSEIGQHKTERNVGMFREACSLRRRNVPEAKAWDKLLALNNVLCTPPLEHSELKKLFDSAWKYPPGYDRTELGNARRVVDRFGHDLRYVIGDKFFTWNGHHWVEDQDSLRSTAWVKQTLDDIRDDAVAQTNPDEAKKTFAWAFTSQATHHIEASLRSARSEHGIAIKATQFDADPMMFGVANGVVDLRDGSFRESRRDDYISKHAGCDFDVAAECPTWIRFIHRVGGDDPAYDAYLKEAVGYTLTGDTTERCFFFTYGTGDNGKSVFLEILKALLGGYGKNIRTDTLMAHVRRNKGGASEDEARLAGARLVTANETEEGMRFDAAFIKDITGGGDTITARHLFKASFEYIPAFKLWMRGNHRPSFSGDDAAMGRRLRLLPFTVTIPKREQDHQLIPKLRAELPGILNWAIEGCLAWRRDGLSTPAIVRDATTEYIKEEDVVGNFIADCCETGAQYSATNQVLWSAWTAWCKAGGRDPGELSDLTKKLIDRGCKKARKNSARFVVGLRVTDQAKARSEPYDF